VKVAIVGGTGPFGRGLAVRLREAGDRVVIGSRDSEKAQAVAAELNVTGMRNDEAVGGADLVVLATTASAAVETAHELRSLLGAPVLSVASEIEVRARSARPTSRDKSVAERVAEVVEVPVTAGLHSLAAGKIAAAPPDEDALVCGNDADAKELSLELAGHVVAGRAIDAGPLEVALALEGLTAAILNINRRYGAHAGLRVTGLP
jgi:NADPH-dependent F420 reductase